MAERKSYVTMDEKVHGMLEEISGITGESMSSIVERLVMAEHEKVFSDPSLRKILEDLQKLADERFKLESELKKVIENQKAVLSKLQPKN